MIRSGGNGACVIDLRAATLNYGRSGGEFVSAVNGIAGGFTNASGVVIENAVGGSGNDRLTGNGFDNTLNGIVGVDTMAGGPGNDTYFVNLMADVITEATGGVTLSLSVEFTLCRRGLKLGF